MNIGDTFSQDVDNIVFGRIETQAARQVMMQKLEKLKEIQLWQCSNLKIIPYEWNS